LIEPSESFRRDGSAPTATFEGEISNVTRSYAGKGVIRYVAEQIILRCMSP
jgi:hypothetical protein